MDKITCKKLKLDTEKTEEEVHMLNGKTKVNKKTRCVVRFGEYEEEVVFLVTDTTIQRPIIGYPFIRDNILNIMNRIQTKKDDHILKFESLEEINKNEDCIITKGPYDGNHYDLKVIGKLKKTIRVHRDQVKVAIAVDSNTLISLKEYLQSMDWLDFKIVEKYITTTRGKNWFSNAKFAFKNFQILEPN